jgi:hypothetical protein
MAGVEVDVDVVDLSARCGEVVEALVLVREILDREHVDRAHQPPFAVIGQEGPRWQGLGINVELAQTREKVRELH